MSKSTLEGATTTTLPEGLTWAPCPICGAEDGTVVHTERLGELGSPLAGRFDPGMPVVVTRCASCRFAYANPRPSASVIRERYQHLSDIRFNVEGMVGRSRLFECVIRAVDRRHPERGRLLDVGCFVGSLLDIAARSRWETWGVEINRVSAAYARDERGHTVSVGDLFDAGFPDDHFDAVTMTDVAEHVIDPLGVFREVHRILKPGGTFAFTCPNVTCQIPKEHLRAALGRGNGVIVGGLGHINHFSERTASAVCRRAGFARAKVRCATPARDRSPRVDAAKRLYTAGARVVRALTGVHVGNELLVVAAKA